MSPSVERVVERLREAHQDLTGEVEEQQRRWRYRLRRGQIWFDKETRDMHRRLKQSIRSYIREGSVLSLLTAPVVYSLVLPVVVLDVSVTVYQWVCFPIYGVTPVRRRAYFVRDRHKLSYLKYSSCCRVLVECATQSKVRRVGRGGAPWTELRTLRDTRFSAPVAVS